MSAVFDAAALERLGAHYPDESVTLRHALCGEPSFEPFFAIERLTLLAAALPAASVEYNAGDVAISQDPDKTPMNGLSAEETVRRIAENQSWMVLKNIEQDRDYNTLMTALLDEIEPVVRGATGPMYKREGFIFVSSPNAVTPFHMDPEHNILLQLRGEKTFRIYPNKAGDVVSDEQQEAFYASDGHRNLPYREEFERHAKPVAMAPGDALYVPVKSPHWVKVGGDISISLSITWRSRASDNEALLRRANGWLRARGLTPPPPGRAPLRDRAAMLGQRLADRLGRR